MTGSDPRHLTGLTEAQRDQAMARWQVLRPHIEDGVPTSRLAMQCGVAARTLQRWAARYRADGLAGLARSERADRGAGISPESCSCSSRAWSKRPPPAIATIHRDITAVAHERGWPVPSYATVHDVVATSTRRSSSWPMKGTRRYEGVMSAVMTSCSFRRWLA